jgi:hypothetical protein
MAKIFSGLMIIITLSACTNQASQMNNQPPSLIEPSNGMNNGTTQVFGR